VLVVRHWCHFLWGGEFLIFTDHFSLKFLLDQRLSTIPQHQWLSKLLGFDFKVKFKLGTTNVVADTLSRRDTEETGEAMALSGATFQLFDDIRTELLVDPDLRALYEDVAAGKRGKLWATTDVLIIVASHVYLPPSSPCVQHVLAAAHGAGHEGTEKTLHQLRRDFHLPGTHAVVRDFVRTCVIYQRNKGEQLHPDSLL
jgi:hypothetical protein